jgi:hypothetical protein
MAVYNMSVFVHLSKEGVVTVHLVRMLTRVVVGFVVPTPVVMRSSVLWNITPCSPLKINRCFAGKCQTVSCWFPVCLTVKMETCFSETSIDFQWTTRRYIPEDRTLRSCLNLM